MNIWDSALKKIVYNTDTCTIVIIDGGAITLYREVVLLTDDRNLRLKAHTRNVPVKDLLQFMEWAKIS